jgi:hypothetical protein
MKNAGLLLAPTGSDLARFDENTVFSGVHYDLNFLTIHGKSNYGGLYIWLRNGQKKESEFLMDAYYFRQELNLSICPHENASLDTMKLYIKGRS